MAEVLGWIVLCGLAWYCFRSGKQIGSRLGFRAGRQDHRRRFFRR